MRRQEPAMPHKKADDWPLSIHENFWRDCAFVKWQALRRNARYRRNVERFHELFPWLLQTSEITHLLREYPPPPRSDCWKNPYLGWTDWAINQGTTRKQSERLEREIHERLSKTVKTGRVDLWPVPVRVCFPHPYVLDKLRPLPFAIPVEPVNRKRTCQPYEALVETGLRRPKYLKLDASLPKDILCRQVVSYLEGLRSVVQQKRQIINLKPVFRKVLAQIPRRKISLHVDDVPYWFAVWDLRQQGLRVFSRLNRPISPSATILQLSFPEIAGILWPNEYDPYDKRGFPGLRGGEKYSAVQRAQDYYANAKSLIKSLVMPHKKSTT
jgi:hypothetical protein